MKFFSLKKVPLRKAVSVYFKVSFLFGAFVGGWLLHMDMVSSSDHCSDEETAFPKALQVLMDSFIGLINSDSEPCSYDYFYLYGMLCVYILLASIVLWLPTFVVLGVVKIVKRFKERSK